MSAHGSWRHTGGLQQLQRQGTEQRKPSPSKLIRRMSSSRPRVEEAVRDPRVGRHSGVGRCRPPVYDNWSCSHSVCVYDRSVRASWVVYLLLLSFVSRNELLAASDWCTTPSSPSWRAAAVSGGVITASDVRRSPRHTIHCSAILSQPLKECPSLTRPQAGKVFDVLFVFKVIEGGNGGLK